jgi:RimJ/RimL family protein N-acetyltransferase
MMLSIPTTRWSCQTLLQEKIGQSYMSRAVSKVVIWFTELELDAMNAWPIEQDAISIRVLEHNHSPLIGTEHQSHNVDGRRFNRLLFDLPASEHKALCPTSPQARG